MRLSENPDRLIMLVPGLSGARARTIANAAVAEARRKMPKMSGWAASRIFPLYGKGFFGVGFLDSYVWFQEKGIRPFTMTSLAGRTIPMWINDPTGVERQRNPRARTRVTLSGVNQVLIFRKVAQIGATKTIRRRNKVTGAIETTSVPASYPGAPGRIAVRQAGSPNTTPGRVGGRIAPGNVGIRWRHPGLAPRGFLNNAISLAAQWYGILPIRIYVADRGWRARF